MLDARAIYRLLIDDEQSAPAPVDPNQLGLDFNQDELLDPKSEVFRYAQVPFAIPGAGATDLYPMLLGELARRERKKVANNTYVVRYPDRLAVRFHQTDVVIAYPDGKVEIQTGGWWPGGDKISYGWRSAPGTTTLERINTWLVSGWSIFKSSTLAKKLESNEWFWYNSTTGVGYSDSDFLLPYADGDAILPNGSLQCSQQPIQRNRRRKRAV